MDKKIDIHWKYSGLSQGHHIFIADDSGEKSARLKKFSAADIETFLTNRLPYYTSKDGTDSLYIILADDIEAIAYDLYQHLVGITKGKTNEQV